MVKDGTFLLRWHANAVIVPESFAAEVGQPMLTAVTGWDRLTVAYFHFISKNHLAKVAFEAAVASYTILILHSSFSSPHK